MPHSAGDSSAASTIVPPVAKTVPHITITHGDTRTDNYFWLRDRTNPDTIAYLEAENRYTEAVMKHTEELQKKLYEEMLGRIQQTDATVPMKRDDYYYYTRTFEGLAYAFHCRKHGSIDAPEEILLDENVLAKGQKYCRVGNFSVSPDHQLLAYSVDFQGDEMYTIRVKDLRIGELLADEIPNTYYTLEWANDNATFFYTVLDESLRPHKVFRHRLGQKEDVLVFHEPDERFTLELARTRSRAYVVIGIHSSVTSEVRYLSTDHPTGEFQTLLPRVQDVEYDVTHHPDPRGAGERFFVRTRDNAKTFRVVEVPLQNPSKENWAEVIPARADVTIERVAAFRNFLVTEERHRGLIQIWIRDLRTGAAHSIDFPEPAYAAELESIAEFETNIVRFKYSSLVTPPSVFDYNMETHERELKKEQAVLGGFEKAHYQCERLFAKSTDGVEIPISLVYKKGFQRNGKAPLLLYGYGSYGISMDASFRADRFSLINRGWAFAIAHVRGGADMGETWHDAGKMLTKKNTFTDFIACAEHLVANHYTSPSRMAINGRSAGGLLMGAVTNMRPDLFGAVVAGVPFVDSLNTALDASLPLTVGEYEEFGNPASKEFYDYMKSYAPYENVEAKDYPAILVEAGLNDPRVSYWEPAKWTAKLRAHKKDKNVLLLKTNMGSGHFGSSGRYDYLKEIAFEYSFLLDQIGEG
jgi:oligopeptidase B